MDVRKRIALASVPAFSAVLLFLFLSFGVFRDREISGSGPGGAFEYRFVTDDDERAGQPHAVSLALRPLREGGVRNVRAVFRAPEETRTNSVDLRRMEPGWTWVGTLPARNAGERWIVYFAVDDDRTAEALGKPIGEATDNPPRPFTIPEGAPENRRPFHVTFKEKAPAALMAFHIGLMACAGILLLHALYFVLLYLLVRFPGKGMDRSVLRQAWILSAAAFGCFFLGAVPLGILVARAVFGTGFEGWPFGGDVTHTKAEVVLLAWAAILAWRWDLVRARGDPRPAADKVFAVLFLAALGACGIALAVPRAFSLS